MENHIGKEFIEMTKYPNLEPSLQSQGVPLPPLETPAPKDSILIDLPDGKSFTPRKIVLLNWLMNVKRCENTRMRNLPWKNSLIYCGAPRA